MADESTRQRLRKRAVRGDKALLCCETGRASVTREVLGILSTILDALNESNGANALVLAPGPAVGTWRIITLAEASAAGVLALGGLVLIGASGLNAIAQSLAAQELMGVIGTAISTSVGRSSECEKCVERSVFGQKNPREWVTRRSHPRV